MRLKCCLFFATALFIASSAFSQKDVKPFSHMSLGVKVTPIFGYGFEAATPLHKMVSLRLGVNLTNGIDDLLGRLVGERKFVLPESDGFKDSFGYMPDLSIKPFLDFTHGNLLLDFHPAGSFHLTVGTFMGKSKLGVEGSLVNSKGQPATPKPGESWPVLEIGNQKIDLGLTDGKADLELQLGSSIKPYFGLGFGRAVPKKHVSFKFELGALLQKGYTLRHDGKVINLENVIEAEYKDIHNNINELSKYFVFYPMINFQLNFRIF